MKKLAFLLLSLAVCANLNCATKKMNRSSEFLKGTVSLAAAVGLVYLAYEAPVGKIQEGCTNLLDKITQPSPLKKINNWLSNKTEIGFNFIRKSTPWEQVDKRTIFSFLTIIPAWELGKYGFIKIGNCFKSHKKVSSSKEKN